MLSSGPGHSVSRPGAWCRTGTGGLALLLISTTCVFVIQPLQPQMISCENFMIRLYYKDTPGT